MDRFRIIDRKKKYFQTLSRRICQPEKIENITSLPRSLRSALSTGDSFQECIAAIIIPTKILYATKWRHTTRVSANAPFETILQSSEELKKAMRIFES
jgi:long-subunit acyl-CoA synthetase (AMP-forming)